MRVSRQGASLEELEDRLVKAKQQHDAASMGIKALQTLNKVRVIVPRHIKVE